MTVAIAYIFPQVALPTYYPAAQKFAATWTAHPPGKTPHKLYVIGNGPPLAPLLKKPFERLTVDYLAHTNFGQDLGAFQMAAHTVEADLLVCFGAHVHFWKAGWLDRIVEAFLEHGPSFYGFWGFHEPRPHLRTTAFFLPPGLLQSYPVVISDGHRYQAEHGENSLTIWAHNMGFEPLMVTWSGCFEMPHWEHVTREDTVIFDQHCERIGYK
jgi:hypothetical protein